MNALIPIINNFNFVAEITRLLFVLDAWGFLPDGVTLTADCVKRSNRTITVRWSVIGRNKESPAE
jgi:hypothetical protein